MEELATIAKQGYWIGLVLGFACGAFLMWTWTRACPEKGKEQ